MEAYKDKAWQRSMKLRLDINGMMADFVGEHGLSMADIEKNSAQYIKAAESMAAKRANMKWRELPHNQAEVVARIKTVAERVRSEYDAFVVLGIGGSALGPIAVQQALSHMRYNELSRERRGGPRLYVEDNVDPERMASLLDVIDVEKTMFNVVTKSGGTSETMSQLLYITRILKDKLGDKWSEHVIATTDEVKGNLIKIAKADGLETFYVPDGVGGRFSELCPVGLIAAAVCGIDIEELLAGAAYMDELCSEPDYRSNMAYMAAICETEAMKKGCNISVMMPYADSLKYIADWYAQLWAESLGKKLVKDGKVMRFGQTPVKSLGVTDQHSQVQLYTDGPFDKTITFISVEKYRSDVAVPHVFDDIPGIAFLSGHSLGELISAEFRATEHAVTVSGHMNKNIIMPEVNEFTLGQLIMLFEMQTAFAGELLGIDAFDQPGVEEGKNATYALLGKPGYEAKLDELKNAEKAKKKLIV
mgnify:CR=1 FL=1